MPFLTIYTPTFRRPIALGKCVESIFAQSDLDLQHLVIFDEVGLGIDGMYRDIRNHASRVHGDWVLVLSDDDLLTDPDFVRDLKEFTQDWPDADVIVFKSWKSGRELPSLWQQAPQCGHIDLSNFVVRRDIWTANADKWGTCYEGDYHFIRSLWDQGYTFAWWDRMAVAAQRISRGAPE